MNISVQQKVTNRNELYTILSDSIIQFINQDKKTPHGILHIFMNIPESIINKEELQHIIEHWIKLEYENDNISIKYLTRVNFNIVKKLYDIVVRKPLLQETKF